MPEPKAPFQLRLASIEVKRQLEERAKRNLRSLNAEINARLIESLANENAPGGCNRPEALNTK